MDTLFVESLSIRNGIKLWFPFSRSITILLMDRNLKTFFYPFVSMPNNNRIISDIWGESWPDRGKVFRHEDVRDEMLSKNSWKGQAKIA